MALMTDARCSKRGCTASPRFHCIDHKIYRNGGSFFRRCDKVLCPKHYGEHSEAQFQVRRLR